MKAFVFDTETTALVQNSLLPDDAQPRIIEFYGCVVDDAGKLYGELEFMCHPGAKISEEITRITGIKPEELEGKPRIKQYLPVIRDLALRADVMVAHNLAYDFAVISAEWRRYGDAPGPGDWPLRKACTVEATEWFKGYRLSLTALHEHLFGAPFTGAHRARTDVEALVRCWLKLREQGDV